MYQYGLIEGKPEEGNWILGERSDAKHVIVQSDRNWEPFLPKFEYQKKDYETYACVSFSGLNCLETYINRLYGFEYNFSDRYTANISGTIYKKGNYLNKVAESIRKDGLVLERNYQYDAKTPEEYYAPISDSITLQAKEFYEDWEIQWEWVGSVITEPDKLWEGLQYAPIQVTVHAWYPPEGPYNRVERERNHAVMLFTGKYKDSWFIYDHYDEKIKRLSWDFNFGAAIKFTANRKTKESYPLKLIQARGSADIYILDRLGRRSRISNMEIFRKGTEKQLWGDLGDIEMVDYPTILEMKEDNPITFELI